jgi:hypothetical protein
MKYGKFHADTNLCVCIKDLAEKGAHNCGSGGRWFESTQLYQISQQIQFVKLQKSGGSLLAHVGPARVYAEAFSMAGRAV